MNIFEFISIGNSGQTQSASKTKNKWYGFLLSKCNMCIFFLEYTSMFVQRKNLTFLIYIFFLLLLLELPWLSTRICWKVLWNENQKKKLYANNLRRGVRMNSPCYLRLSVAQSFHPTRKTYNNASDIYSLVWLYCRYIVHTIKYNGMPFLRYTQRH